ncbi:MAG: S1 family peptidase [Pseudomonadota bacterium]
MSSILSALALLAATAHAAPTPRIIGGDDAGNGEYPFMVTLAYPISAHPDFDTDADTFFCGGTIIAPRWVLTAGHCISTGSSVDSPTSFSLIVGSTTLDTAGGSGTRVTVTGIVRHPDYTVDLENDLALLYLATPVSAGDSVNLAGADALTGLPAGTGLTAIGWGATESANLSATLQEVVLGFLPLDDCTGYYDNDLVDGMTCATFLVPETPVDTCSGDSGGPLLRDVSGQWQQVGITSFGGNTCADSEQPGVYTDVGYYAGFIADVQAKPDLSTTVSELSREGQNASLRFSVRNNSPAVTATGNTLEVSRTTAVILSGAGCTGTGNLACTLPDLAPGAAASIDIDVELPGPGTHTITGTAGSGSGDYWAANDDDARRYTLPGNSGGGGGGAGGAGLLVILLLSACRRRSP